MKLLLIATAPIAIILTYIYIRDKYEKEPFKMLIKALLVGLAITPLVVLAESLFSAFWGPLMAGQFSGAFAKSFLVASFCEELFKYLALMLLVWRSREFNERFDGIVYAVFVSLGFAWIENILYVFSYDNGMGVGISRAFTAVPAHALFGAVMGYYLGLARFDAAKRSRHLWMAWLLPFVFHGLYDFVLMANHKLLEMVFVPLLIGMLVFAYRKINQLADSEPV